MSGVVKDAGTSELRTVTVAGAAANTNITVTGIKPGDRLVAVHEHSAAASPVNRTSVTTIQAVDTIRINDDTTGNTVVVVFQSK